MPEWVVQKFINWTETNNQHFYLKNYKRYNIIPLSPNCQTPPSLFSIFSGTSALTHRLLGFDNPTLSADNILDYKKGFEVWPNHIPLIWDEYLDAEFNVCLSHIPFVKDDLELRPCLTYVNGFNKRVLNPLVSPIDEKALIAIGKLNFECTLLSTAKIELKIKFNGNVLLKKEQELNVFFEVKIPTQLHTYLGFFEVEGLIKLIFLGSWDTESSEINHQTGNAAPFIGSSLSEFYRDGQLGKTLKEGGDGFAEIILQKSCRLLMKRFDEDFLTLVKKGNSQLIIGYQPAFDLFFHDVIGYLDLQMSYYTIKHEQFILNLLYDMMVDLDMLMNDFRIIGGKQAHLIVSSDHGMKPIDRIIHLNAFLKDMGLIKTNANYKIDPINSICIYHVAETGLLCFNNDMVSELKYSIQDIIKLIVEEVHKRCQVMLNIVEMKELQVDSLIFAVGYYVIPPKGVQLKASLNKGYCVESLKTGDHTIFSDDDTLRGVMFDLNETVKLKQSSLETFQIKGLLQNDTLQ